MVNISEQISEDQDKESETGIICVPKPIMVENESSINQKYTEKTICIGGIGSAFNRWIPPVSSDASSSCSSDESSLKKQEPVAESPMHNIIDLEIKYSNISSLDAETSIIVIDSQVVDPSENIVEGKPVNTKYGCLCYFREENTFHHCVNSPLRSFTALLFFALLTTYITTYTIGFVGGKTFIPVGQTTNESNTLIFLRDNILLNISDPALLQDLESPQYKAMYWLANDDKMLDEIDIRNLTLSEYDILTQRYAMAVFYHSTNGDQWYDKGEFLSTKKHICEWGSGKEGVLPSSKHGNVIRCDESHNIQEMFFAVNHLKGQIPSELAQFRKNLVTLELTGNVLHGSIPKSIETMSRIKTLDFHANMLTGSLPYLGNMQDLELLNVRSNRLNGTMCNIGIEHTTELVELDLSYNLFTGTIPQHLGGSELQKVMLEGNNFTGNMTLYCNNSFTPGILRTDCLEEIDCSCCTSCM